METPTKAPQQEYFYRVEVSGNHINADRKAGELFRTVQDGFTGPEHNYPIAYHQDQER